mgnify:CR=1 FL=1
MGIGDHDDLFVGLLQGLQKGVCAGADGDTVAGLPFQPGDFQAQFRGPEVQAVPVQGAQMAGDPVVDDAVGLGPVQPLLPGVALGHMFLPEPVVELQVQQGAVHIQ